MMRRGCVPCGWGLSYGWGCGLPAHVVRGQQNFVDEMNNAIGDFDVGLEDSGFFHHHCAWKHGGQIIILSRWLNQKNRAGYYSFV